MIHKIDLSHKYGNSHISILYPGQTLGISDSGIGSIGRIDQADIQGGTTIKMHPHSNDEILSYFRIGKVIHTDSAGITATIGRKKLMLMKAGKVFYHEEKIIDRLEGLQIFIRPKTADYEPQVLFYELENEDSINTWRLLAASHNHTNLAFTSETEVFDITINDKQLFYLPESALENPVFILYAFQGTCKVNESLALNKGECLIFDEPNISFTTDTEAELVLFVTNKDQDCYKQGMFSGNKG